MIRVNRLKAVTQGAGREIRRVWCVDYRMLGLRGGKLFRYIEG
jgi:hypothetical protein